MSHYENFTSLSPQEEQTFVVYEQRSQESAKKALTLGLIVAGVVFVLVIAIVFSYDKPKSLMEGDDMGMLADEKEQAAARESLKSKPAPAPAAAEGAAPAPAPAAAEGAAPSEEE